MDNKESIQMGSDLLEGIVGTKNDDFLKQKTVLSFQAYLGEIQKDSYRFTRNAVEYLLDAMAYFGVDAVENEEFASSKYYDLKIFDRKNAETNPIVGCQKAHNEIYRILNNFKRLGHPNKLILLHGPNGSAKSSTMQALANGLAAYSNVEEGAVYRFNWIFPKDPSLAPTERAHKIGFGSGRMDEDGSKYQSFAHLSEDEISCKISSELHEHPFYLIEPQYRERFFEALGIKNGEARPHLLMPGLSKKNQLIYEHLLVAYDGSCEKVFRHVQVERFFFSKRYREGISTVEPQMSIDAVEKQLTMDKNIANLPPVLQNIRYSELFGPLIEANRGFLEFSDMLKRPVDTFKYLLNSVEKNHINLQTSTVLLDEIFFATTNDKHLDAFKGFADFASFKGRIEAVPMPYVLNVKDEKKIYENDREKLAHHVRFSPHAMEILALWSVMSRLHKPNDGSYEGEAKKIVSNMDAFLKAKIYADQSLVGYLEQKEAKVARGLKVKLQNEFAHAVHYEGRFGPSPREVKAILQKTVDTENGFHGVSVIKQIEQFVKDKTAYEFLQIQPQKGFFDQSFFIEKIKEEYSRLFSSDVHVALDLVDPKNYEESLRRYIEHATAFVRKEKVYDSSTKSYQEPSPELFEQMESTLDIEPDKRQEHRQKMLNRIAAFRIDHPKKDLDYGDIFSDLFGRLRQKVEDENKVNMQSVMQNLTTEDSWKEGETESLVNRLKERGYDSLAIRESARFYLKNQKK